jgi:hypothetical protein
VGMIGTYYLESVKPLAIPLGKSTDVKLSGKLMRI